MKKVFLLLTAALALTCMACTGTVGGDKQNYTVTFQTNGADSINSKSVAEGSKVTEPDPAPQKTGYDFLGWYSDSSFTTKYDFNTAVTSDLTLYAKWQIQIFSVVFDTDGGSSVTTQTVEYDKTATKPAAPTKDGFDFEGWYTDDKFTTEFSFDTKIKSDLKIFAKWTERSQPNPEPENPEQQQQQGGEEQQQQGGEQQQDPPPVVTYNVKFETNGGTAITQKTVNEGEAVARPLDPEREGYIFTGWYADEALNATYNFEAPVTAAVTIYAKWTIKTFTVNFVVQDAQTEVPPQQINYNGTVTQPSDPEKEGYNFGGWYADEGLNTTYHFDTSVTAPVTIYAKWTIKTFTVNFVVQDDPDSPTQITIPSQQINYNGTVTQPADPQQQGAEFRGWYSDSKFKTSYDFNTAVQADLTLYGHLYEFPIADENYTETNTTGYTSRYPENFEYPKYHDSTKELPAQLVTGASVQSTDNIITVTPRSDGLLIEVNYKAQNASVYWRHNTLKIKDTTSGKEKETGIVEIPINETETTRTTQILYPFTESGRQYKVWIEHMGTETEEWGGWASTSENPATVTAIGGSGEFRVTCAGMDYSVNYDSTRKLTFNNYEVYKPSILNGITPTAKIRAENGGRWVGEYIERENFLFPAEVVQIDNQEMINFLDQNQQLFIVVNLMFEYNGLKYQQEVYSNYDYTLGWQHHDNWIKDPGTLSGIGQLPLIKITSTENGGSNQFVTVPISPHVKDQQSGKDNIPDPQYENCTIAVDDGTPYPGQVKVRGNWTTNYAKKSLRIKFTDKHNMCGLNKGKEFKSWVLLSVFKDSSMLRDVTAFKMFHLMFPDYYASDACLVEVEVNGTYMGVYVLAEQQQANKNRVSISEPKKNSSDTQIGYLMEFDNYYYTEKLNERFEIDYRGDISDSNNKNLQNINKGYTIKSDVYDEAQKDFIMKYMNDLWKICYEAVYNKNYYKFNYEYKLVPYTPEGDTDDEKCKNCINRIIDTTSLANTYIFNEIVCDPDLYWSSFYMDIDFAEGADKKLRFEAPWDFDSTMGNKSFAIEDTSHENFDKKNMSKINEMFAGSCQTDVNCHDEKIHGNPWMMIFINQTWFKNLVKEQWAGINREAIKSELSSFIDSTSTNYETVFNYTRQIWGNSGEYEKTRDELCAASKAAALDSQAASAEYFKNWLTARIDAVDNIINNILQ